MTTRGRKITTRCLEPHEFEKLANNTASDSSLAHVQSCAVCADAWRVVRALVVNEVSSEYASIAVDEVDDAVRELLAVPAGRRPEFALLNARYHTAGVARSFLTLARLEEERDLALAAAHAHVATVITGRLTMKARSAAALEFLAWKERSTIHRERGEHDAARSALMMARAAAEMCEGVEMKRAVLLFAEACICAELDVWEPEQALTLLRQVEPVFAHYEPGRLRDILTLRGGIAWRRGEHHAALRDFRAVFAATIPKDREAYADALRNLGAVLVDVGELDEASEALDDARAIDTALGRTVQVLRAEYHVARSFAARKQHDTAAEMFADVSSRYAKLGDVDFSLRAGKEHARVLVAAGRVRDALRVLRALLARSVQDTDRRRFTADALSYLAELAEREALTLDVADSVSAYVDDLYARPAKPFYPPFPLSVM